MSLPTIYNGARNELIEIAAAGARGLKEPGQHLMPVKREMLGDATEPELVLEACHMLFAAILHFEAAQWAIKYATDPVTLVSARMEAGRAQGVVESLFFGPTKALLVTAMDRAPIAFYALSEASPKLSIIDRCK